MGYIKVNERRILNYIDNYSEFPKGWEKFVEQQAIMHNLIIKYRSNRCFCTSCKNYFVSTKKVNEEVKCPHCHHKYLIKRSNLKHYEFKEYLSILDLVEGEFIIRYFELKTSIDESFETHLSVVEFAREILKCKNGYSRVFVNERVSRCQCHIYISHSNYYNSNKWREYTRNYSLIDYSIVFDKNLKKLLKDTDYKYSCIWDIAKHCGYIDLEETLRNKNVLGNIEMLAKMKLYNLAVNADKFQNRGSFNKIFGVSKEFYPFMKRNNVTYTQLKLLNLLKKTDMKNIRYLEKYVEYGGSTNNLEEISKRISIDKFIKYAKMHRGKIDISTYNDYLRFAKTLGLDLKNNRYVFPKNLRCEHDKLEKEYEIHNQKIINESIIKRGKELALNTYNNGQFMILPANSLKDLINESKQQNNCVRTYAERYANGECDIYFMRQMEDIGKSLVTIEVKDNHIVQSRIKNNQIPNDIQNEFLKEWENVVLKGVA